MLHISIKVYKRTRYEMAINSTGALTCNLESNAFLCSVMSSSSANKRAASTFAWQTVSSSNPLCDLKVKCELEPDDFLIKI
jgi:hypothetical protein